MQQEIHSLVVHCTFVDVGCTWIGQLRYLQVILGLELWLIDIFVRVLDRLMIGGPNIHCRYIFCLHEKCIDLSGLSQPGKNNNNNNNNNNNWQC